MVGHANIISEHFLASISLCACQLLPSVSILHLPSQGDLLWPGNCSGAPKYFFSLELWAAKPIPGLSDSFLWWIEIEEGPSCCSISWRVQLTSFQLSLFILSSFWVFLLMEMRPGYLKLMGLIWVFPRLAWNTIRAIPILSRLWLVMGSRYNAETQVKSWRNCLYITRNN